MILHVAHPTEGLGGFKEFLPHNRNAMKPSLRMEGWLQLGFEGRRLN